MEPETSRFQMKRRKYVKTTHADKGKSICKNMLQAAGTFCLLGRHWGTIFVACFFFLFSAFCVCKAHQQTLHNITFIVIFSFTIEHPLNSKCVAFDEFCGLFVCCCFFFLVAYWHSWNESFASFFFLAQDTSMIITHQLRSLSIARSRSHSTLFQFS